MTREDPLVNELQAAGGVIAPHAALARLRLMLTEALRHGPSELKKTRLGYSRALTAAFAVDKHTVFAATPAPNSLQVDPHVVTQRGWLLIAAAVGTIVELAQPRERLTSASNLALQVGTYEKQYLVLAYPKGVRLSAIEVEELLPPVFSKHIANINRLRVNAVALRMEVLGSVESLSLRQLGVGALRGPIGVHHPLQIAEVIARLGGTPAESQSVETLEESVLEILSRDSEQPQFRPHDDPDRVRRIARRIVQRLAGMGKWGGYHTNFVHLARGFAGNERADALYIGESLISAGVLIEKQSVGQRHVYLNPRRAGDIYRLIDFGELPKDLRLPKNGD